MVFKITIKKSLLKKNIQKIETSFILNKKILTRPELLLVTSFQAIIILCIIKFTYISVWGWIIYTFMMMSILSPPPQPRTNNIS